MKKTRLIIDHVYEFELTGIISSVKFHKMAWILNKTLGLHLIRQEDYFIETRDNQRVGFGNYLYKLENSSFRLYKNKSVEGENRYLIPEYTHFDYIIRNEKQSQSFSNQEIMKVLKEVKWIEYIAAVQVESLKSKDNFLT